MLLRIAWRNLWRNKRRSGIVLASVIVGLIAIILDESVVTGFVNQMLENQIGAHVTHVLIHRKGFRENMLVDRTIPDPAALLARLDTMHGVKAFDTRVVSFGLASSAENSSGAMIVGVGPREDELTTIASSIVEGQYVDADGGGILIGKKLAEKLNVTLGEKIVLMASARDGSVANAMYRVCGLYSSFSSEFEKTYVYITRGDAQAMLGIGDAVHEIAVRVEDPSRVASIAAVLRVGTDPRTECLSYEEILPLLVSQVEMYKNMMWFIYLIVGAAMVFGIVNAMLMSVFERIREFGVLLATGMSTGTLFRLVLLEALLLGLVGTALGMGAGLAVYARLAATGLDLAVFAEGMTAWGIGTVITPELSYTTVLRQALVVPLLCMLAALYPAWKAVRLQPVQAISFV
ncbi:MAG: ABC transporter permease [Ignavibacteriae bacterium]|nr:ABC transporter permease [Ignavibacteriota bacterium]